jgi:hypothetical protein
VYDHAQEEVEVGKAIEKSLTPVEFNKQMEQNAQALDLLALLSGNAPPPAGQSAVARQRRAPSLYSDDLAYLSAALGREEGRYDYSHDAERSLISLTIPKDLERTLKRVAPKNSLPKDGRLLLSTNRKLVQEEIRKAREGEHKWPRIHLLWNLHPAIEWLNYKLLVNFARAQAPVVTLRGLLPPQEMVFLIQGEIPNRKGQPVVHSWFGVRFDAGRFIGIEELKDFLGRTGFDQKNVANPGHIPDVTQAKTLLPEAIAEARRHMSACWTKLNGELRPKLEQAQAQLDSLRTAKQRQLDLDYDQGQLAGIRLRQKQQRQSRIDRIFAEYTQYVRDTLTTEDAAFVRVAAVFRGESTYVS